MADKPDEPTPPNIEFVTFRDPKCPRCGRTYIYQAQFERHWALDHEGSR